MGRPRLTARTGLRRGDSRYGDDHIDGDGTNNRADKLRSVTRAQNSQNLALPKANRSGVMGVTWRPRISRWEAHITEGGKATYLGVYQSLDEAVAARRKAEVERGFHPNHGRARVEDRPRRKGRKHDVGQGVAA